MRDKKMIGGKQILVCWNLEDLKVFHVDPKEVTILIKWLEGTNGKLSIKRGKVHKYLGMTLDFRTPGDLQVIMVDYIKGMLEDLPEVRMGRSTILTDNNLFQVRPEDNWTLLN